MNFAVIFVLPNSYCGVDSPNWSEIRHFVKFLDLQLESCESSVFTNTALVGDVMQGMKGFVVKFMIRMSRVSKAFINFSQVYESRESYMSVCHE